MASMTKLHRRQNAQVKYMKRTGMYMKVYGPGYRKTGGWLMVKSLRSSRKTDQRILRQANALRRRWWWYEMPMVVKEELRKFPELMTPKMGVRVMDAVKFYCHRRTYDGIYIWDGCLMDWKDSQFRKSVMGILGR